MRRSCPCPSPGRRCRSRQPCGASQGNSRPVPAQLSTSSAFRGRLNQDRARTGSDWPARPASSPCVRSTSAHFPSFGPRAGSGPPLPVASAIVRAAESAVSALPRPGTVRGPWPARQPFAGAIAGESQRVPTAGRTSTPAGSRPVRPGPARPPAPGPADPLGRSSHSGLAALVLFAVIRAADSGPGPPARSGPARLIPSPADVDPPSCSPRSRLSYLVVLAS
jgi:hypothetical protein